MKSLEDIKYNGAVYTVNGTNKPNPANTWIWVEGDKVTAYSVDTGTKIAEYYKQEGR